MSLVNWNNEDVYSKLLQDLKRVGLEEESEEQENEGYYSHTFVSLIVLSHIN